MRVTKRGISRVLASGLAHFDDDWAYSVMYPGKRKPAAKAEAKPKTMGGILYVKKTQSHAGILALFALCVGLSAILLTVLICLSL